MSAAGFPNLRRFESVIESCPGWMAMELCTLLFDNSERMRALTPDSFGGMVSQSLLKQWAQQRCETDASDLGKEFVKTWISKAVDARRYAREWCDANSGASDLACDKAMYFASAARCDGLDVKIVFKADPYPRFLCHVWDSRQLLDDANICMLEYPLDQLEAPLALMLRNIVADPSRFVYLAEKFRTPTPGPQAILMQQWDAEVAGVVDMDRQLFGRQSNRTM